MPEVPWEMFVLHPLRLTRAGPSYGPRHDTYTPNGAERRTVLLCATWTEACSRGIGGSARDEGEGIMLSDTTHMPMGGCAV